VTVIVVFVATPVALAAGDVATTRGAVVSGPVGGVFSELQPKRRRTARIGVRLDLNPVGTGVMVTSGHMDWKIIPRDRRAGPV
jgi:hypothetical protein